MDKVVDDMIDHLKSHEDNAIIDLQEVFRALSLDTIAYCAFGIEINSFKDPNNVLTKRCIQAFTDLNFKNIMESLIVHLLQYFPFLFKRMSSVLTLMNLFNPFGQCLRSSCGIK